jgi:hypothetical protein
MNGQDRKPKKTGRTTNAMILQRVNLMCLPARGAFSAVAIESILAVFETDTWAYGRDFSTPIGAPKYFWASRNA